MLSTLAGAQLPTRRQPQATQSSVPQTFAPRSRSVCGPASRCRLASGTHSPPPSCRACRRCRRLRPCGRALAVRAVMTAPPEGHTAGAHPCRDPYSHLDLPAPLCFSPLPPGRTRPCSRLHSQRNAHAWYCKQPATQWAWCRCAGKGGAKSCACGRSQESAPYL